MQESGTPSAGEFPAALHNDHADLLHLPETRVPQRRVRLLSEVRRGDRRTQAAARVQHTERSQRMNSITPIAIANDIELSDEERQPCEKIGRASCRERV